MASDGLIHPSKPSEGLVPSYLSPGQRQAAAWLPYRSPGSPPSSLGSVTVPTKEGPGTVCGSSWGSGEVLDRVADLHAGPIEGPAQTQHSQQDHKRPGCVDASIPPCMLPCAKSKASSSDRQE